MPEEPIENPLSRWFETPIINSGLQMAMTPEGGANGEGSVVIRKFFGFPGQRWCVQGLADGTYRILHTSSGKVLDVAGASMQPGARLICWPWHGGDNQRFKIERSHSGGPGSILEPKHSPGRYVTTDPTDGAPVTAGFTGATTGGQQWRIGGDIVMPYLPDSYWWVLERTPPVNGTGFMTQVRGDGVQALLVQLQRVPPLGLYRIAVPDYRTNDDPAGLPKVLDIEGASTANGARAILWDWHGGKNQLFAISPSGEKWGHVIRAEHSLKVIQIGEPGFAGIGPLVQADFTGADNQTWRL